MTAAKRSPNPSEPFPRYVKAAVARQLVVDPGTGCWLWQGRIASNGYPLAERHRRPMYVHRWVWAMSGRRLEVDTDLDHECHVKHCSNPGHLTARTHTDHGAVSRAWQIERGEA